MLGAGERCSRSSPSASEAAVTTSATPSAERSVIDSASQNSGWSSTIIASGSFAPALGSACLSESGIV